jgi:hypothetical protein
MKRLKDNVRLILPAISVAHFVLFSGGVCLSSHGGESIVNY